MTRRSFFALVASALVAARAPRLAAGEPREMLYDPGYGFPLWRGWSAPTSFQIGDIVTFSGSPVQYVVKSIERGVLQLGLGAQEAERPPGRDDYDARWRAMSERAAKVIAGRP